MERQAVNFSMSGQPRGLVFSIWIAVCCASVAPVLCFTTSPAHALSEIKREDLPSPATPPAADDDMAPPGSAVPLPDPLGTTPPAAAQPKPSDETEPEQSEP